MANNMHRTAWREWLNFTLSVGQGTREICVTMFDVLKELQRIRLVKCEC
jgi:hypothetical protein